MELEVFLSKINESDQDLVSDQLCKNNKSCNVKQHQRKFKELDPNQLLNYEKQICLFINLSDCCLNFSRLLSHCMYSDIENPQKILNWYDLLLNTKISHRQFNLLVASYQLDIISGRSVEFQVKHRFKFVLQDGSGKFHEQQRLQIDLSGMLNNLAPEFEKRYPTSIILDLLWKQI